MGYERENASEWMTNDDGQGMNVAKDISSSEEEGSKGSKVQVGQGETGGRPIRTTPSTSVTQSPPKVQISSGQIKGRLTSKPPTAKLSSSTVTAKKGNAGRFGNPVRSKQNITFVRVRDNPAKAAWKSRRPHNGVFVSRNNWNQVGSGLDSRKLYAKLEEMGARLGTYIQPPSSNADRTLRIWGNDSQVKATRDELLSYCRAPDVQSSKRRGPAAEFANIRPQSEKQKRLVEYEMKLLQKKLFYKQVPEDGHKFGFAGAFLWPTEDVEATELLGKNCEAFDGIRSHCNCYIEFDSQLSVFRLKATSAGRILGALQRIEGTLREFTVRISRPRVAYMLELLNEDEVRQEVKLVTLSNKKNTLATTGAKLGKEDIAAWVIKSESLNAKYKSRMQRATAKTLSSLLWYRGRLRMRVLLGNFAFSMIRWPQGASSVLLNTFIDDNLKKSGNKGTIMKGLQINGGPEDILNQFWNMHEHFQPVSSSIDELKDVSPTFVARFEFHNTELGRMRLEIEVVKNEGNYGDWTKEEVRWTHIADPHSQYTHAQPSPLELNMVGLNGHTSWQLCILTSNVVERARLTPEMIDFAKAVKFNPPVKSTGAMVTGQRVFTIPGYGYLPIASFEQKTALRYQVRANPDYVFEVARYDMYPPEVVPNSGQQQSTTRNMSMTPNTTDWGGSLYNDSWDGILAKNSKLELGEMASWTPTLDTFFPQDPRSKTSGPNAGFSDFLKHMKMIAQLLDQTKAKLSSNGLIDGRTQQEIDALYEDSDDGSSQATIRAGA